MNAPEKIQPIPTEYKGVTFRSKSEAIFARHLDNIGMIWEYEPLRFQVDGGWTPDFWAVRLQPAERSSEFFSPQCIHSFIIEYKPAMVTPTYLEELGKRFDTLPLADWKVLACGSPFTDDPRVVLTRTRSGWKQIPDAQRLFDGIEESARYRFDLEHGERTT